MPQPKDYGRYYWCIKTSLSESGEIYINADRAEFLQDGTLVLRSDTEYSVNLAIASGQWTACYAASALDGSAVAVDHWKGEIAEAA